jgi:hypothetical protein
MSEKGQDRRSPASVRKSALWLAAIALAIFLGFIFLSVSRA